jgi:DNA-binding MarR family transcriptional regulator
MAKAAKKIANVKAAPVEASLIDLLTEIIPASRRVIILGSRLGTRSARGGYWALLRPLIETGPHTVPQLARRRNVSRQNIQVVISELLDRGDVELIENPAHKRSKLVRVTPQGRAAFKKTTERLVKWAGETAPAFKQSDLETATRVLRRLSELLAR